MSVEVMETLLRARKPARICDLSVRPLENPLLPDIPIVMQRGQAHAYVLEAADGRRWILKKFRAGRNLDRRYLDAVSKLLPSQSGFLAGTERKVLQPSDLAKAQGCHYSKTLAAWLDGSVLMPCVAGKDWAAVADDLRDGTLSLPKGRRLLLCRNLTELVRLLEERGCSHRDLSAGNILIDLSSLTVFLIDFDSLYHPNVQMPAETTCGTSGYIAPFVWRGDRFEPSVSWCPHADRFSLAVLCVEFLTIDQGAPSISDGGAFDQDDLLRRSGPSLSRARDILKAQLPETLQLFEAALQSTSYETCPSPEAWLNRLGYVVPNHHVPRLSELEPVKFDWFRQYMARRKVAAPPWPTPRLIDMRKIVLNTPRIQPVPVTIPDDPWTS